MQAEPLRHAHVLQLTDVSLHRQCDSQRGWRPSDISARCFVGRVAYRGCIQTLYCTTALGETVKEMDSAVHTTSKRKVP